MDSYFCHLAIYGTKTKIKRITLNHVSEANKAPHAWQKKTGRVFASVYKYIIFNSCEGNIKSVHGECSNEDFLFNRHYVLLSTL